MKKKFKILYSIGVYSVRWYNKIYYYFYLENRAFSWFYRKIYTPLSILLEAIKKLLDYAPTLWRDRDYDTLFMWRLLFKKFERMEKLARRNNSFSTNEIKIAMLILDRLGSGTYYLRLTKKYQDKYPDLAPWQLERQLYSEDVAFLFEFIKKYHQSWWD